MAKRVAITIAGAVSLGAYEAGVLYELLEAFRLQNEQADRDKRPDTKIYVDVLTGASAGGMTAAMLGERLMFDGASMQGEFTNPLYMAWVQRISLKGLACLGWREWPLRWHSLLSSDLIEAIGREMLVDSMAQGMNLSGAHATVEVVNGVSVPLSVGLAITNLNGIDYMLPIVGNPDGGFHYTRSVDQKLFTIGTASRPDSGPWVDLCGAAVASGAFPIAFRPKELERYAAEYGDPLPQPPATPQPGETYVTWTGSDPQPFVYCDGGVLQNQPLGMAKNFVDERVKAAKKSGSPEAASLASDRLYAFISPHAVLSTVAKDLRARKMSIVRMAIELFHTYIRQATFHDWIMAEGMNQRVKLLDRRAADLAAALISGDLDAASLEGTAAKLNSLLIANPAAERLRLQQQYSEEYARVLGARGQQTANALLDAIATLEAAADLGTRDIMKIVAVIADGRTELAGSGFAAFAGFFSPNFREHDYWMGRVKAREYLLRSDVMEILGVEQWANDGTLHQVPANRSTIQKLPLSFWQMLRPALLWLMWMIAIRPEIWISVGIIVAALVWWGHHACH